MRSGDADQCSRCLIPAWTTDTINNFFWTTGNATLRSLFFPKASETHGSRSAITDDIFPVGSLDTQEYSGIRSVPVRSVLISVYLYLALKSRKPDGFVLTYSVTSTSTFDSIRRRHHHTVLSVGGPSPAFILIGNKCDLADAREVSGEAGAQLAETLGCQFFETSARSAHNVDDAMFALVRHLRRVHRMPWTVEELPLPPTVNPRKGKTCVIL